MTDVAGGAAAAGGGRRRVPVRRLRRHPRRPQVQVRPHRPPRGHGRRFRALHGRGAGGDGRPRSQRGRVRRHPRPGRPHPAAMGAALRGGGRRPLFPRRAIHPRLPAGCCGARWRRPPRWATGWTWASSPRCTCCARSTAAGGRWSPRTWTTQPTRGYDLEATILADPFLDPMVGYMDELGWDVFSFDHEGGDGQYEFDFAYTDALAMADRMVLFRLLAKHVARTLGCIATFMPKPWSDAFGSGAHINMSLADADIGRQPLRPRAASRAPRGWRPDDRGTPSWPTSSPPACCATPARSPPWSARRSTPTSGCCPAG